MVPAADVAKAAVAQGGNQPGEVVPIARAVDETRAQGGDVDAVMTLILPGQRVDVDRHVGGRITRPPAGEVFRGKVEVAGAENIDRGQQHDPAGADLPGGFEQVARPLQVQVVEVATGELRRMADGSGA